jgi:hypothetical protein
MHFSGSVKGSAGDPARGLPPACDAPRLLQEAAAGPARGRQKARRLRP